MLCQAITHSYNLESNRSCGRLREILKMVEKEKKNSVYVVSIVGNNTNFEVPISDMTDFENLEGILEILKKKLRG